MPSATRSRSIWICALLCATHLLPKRRVETVSAACCRFGEMQRISAISVLPTCKALYRLTSTRLTSARASFLALSHCKLTFTFHCDTGACSEYICVCCIHTRSHQAILKQACQLAVSKRDVRVLFALGQCLQDIPQSTQALVDCAAFRQGDALCTGFTLAFTSSKICQAQLARNIATI
jgi:hypothetical protein